MPQPQWQNSPEDKQSLSSETLAKSIDKLKQRGHQQAAKKYGFSSPFKQQVTTQEMALQLCAQAMEALAGDYVHQLARFKESEKTLECLDALEKAESVWQGEAAIIEQFDAEGGEKHFLLQMRQQAYHVLEHKLHWAASCCSRDPRPENVALCQAIIAVMDGILRDWGKSPESPDRQRWYKIAKAFL